MKHETFGYLVLAFIAVYAAYYWIHQQQTGHCHVGYGKRTGGWAVCEPAPTSPKR